LAFGAAGVGGVAEDDEGADEGGGGGVGEGGGGDGAEEDVDAEGGGERVFLGADVGEVFEVGADGGRVGW